MNTTSNRIFITDEWYYTLIRAKNRIIHIPCDELKAKQSFFLNAIKWVYPYKSDTLESAKVHCGKKWILKMDIRHFYDSVPMKEIEKVVRSVCERMNKPENTLFYVLFVTLNGKLPTGAPTSAHIANACFLNVDKEIKRVCQLYGVDYSRYMDDLTFSAYDKESLQQIEKRVKEFLKFKGYKINPQKTKYISDNKQQNILGLVVNGNRVRLSKDFKRRIRAMIHSYFLYKYKYNSVNLSLKHYTWNEKREQQLFGYLAYIKHVDFAYYKRLQNYQEKLKSKTDH